MRWRCATCGEEHVGLPLDIAFDEPLYWDGGRAEGDRLTPDLCTWTDDDGVRCFFVRGVIELPILDHPDTFAYGVWSSLSEQSYESVLERWQETVSEDGPIYFGWLSNSLPGYPETLNLPLDVVSRGPRLRPTFVLHVGEHPLIREQRQGITMERVREIAALTVHI
jgi:hypothetical protein